VSCLASVVVPSWNGIHLLPQCLASLERQTHPRLEVVVADGASTDGTDRWLAATYPQVRLVPVARNRGFAGNVNAGLRAARGDVLLLLNNDAEADADWVERCVAAFERQPRAGSIASRVLYRGRATINSAGDVLGLDGLPRQRGSGAPDGARWDEPTGVFGAMGGAAAYRRAMLADVGLFDESYFMYLEDVDLAFRAQLRGWTCAYEPTARVEHRGGASGGGVLESFYNGRNLIRLLVKCVPDGLVLRLLPAALRAQRDRSVSAVRAWRGAAARATLRGQLAGLALMGDHLAARRMVQRQRLLSEAEVFRLLVASQA
jgi:GT2 family glycosyltransferase